MPRFSDAQIRELASGAGYDRVPRFVTRFADAIGSVEGRILRYLAHRTLGFGQYATVVSTRDLAAIAGTNNYQPALDWLLAHGVVGREAVSHGGRRTYAHWIHTDYTAWDIPHEVWLRLLALREQGCWDDPRFSSESLQTLDRRKMVRVGSKTGYDVDDLRGRVEQAAKADGEPRDRPDGGVEGQTPGPLPAPDSGADGETKGQTPAPNGGAVSAPPQGAATPQYWGPTAPNGGAEEGPPAPEPQGLTAPGKTFERTERVPQRTGAGLRPAPSAGGPEVFESRSATAAPSLDAPATPRPTCDGERTDCRPPGAGGNNDSGPPLAGNGLPKSERPTDGDLGERQRLTDDFRHLRVLARQMYRLGGMAIREFDEGTLRFGTCELDSGFEKLMIQVPAMIIQRHEKGTLGLPEALRVSKEEYRELLVYVRRGGPATGTVDSAPPGRFHPSRHEPRYDSPGDAELWRGMLREFEVLYSCGFHRILHSDELAALEVPGDPSTRTGPLDLSRILAPPPEDPLAPRAALTDDLHHMRVIARQLDRMWRPMAGHLNGGAPREGWSPTPEQYAVMTRLQALLARSLVERYEAEVLRLPGEFRTSGDEFTSFIRQVHTRRPSDRGAPVPWRFDVRLHQPRYSEPGDREIWRTCLGLLPADLPGWLVEIARSGEIVELPRRPRTRATGGASRPDDREWEPHGTEEDGPQPP